MDPDTDGVAHRVAGFISRARKLSDLDWRQDIFASKLVSSMFVLELIMFLEGSFQISVEDDDLNMENFSSVGAISTFVTGKLRDMASVQ